MAKTFLIRGFPDTLHHACRLVAAWEKTTMTDLILKALAEYLKQYTEAGGLLEGRGLEETEEKGG